MSFNIVTTIISLFGPAVLEKLASATGLNATMARGALGAAVPAVLAALGGKASSEAGAKALFDSVSRTDTSMLGDLASALTAGSGEKLMKGGLGSLTSLLGDAGTKGLTGAIARQAGIGSDAAASIVALAGQGVMGQLAKSVSTGGLDAAGLGSMLRAQQSNITSALPSGLGQMLQSSGVSLGGFTDQANRVAANVAHETAKVAKSGTNWLVWALPILLALAALWWFLGNRTPAVVTEAVPAAVKEVVVDGVDVGKQITGALDGLKTTLGGITDAATAQAALPKLDEAVKAVDGIGALASKLSADQRTMLAGLVAAALPAIKELAAKVTALPGVGDIAKPTIDGLLSKIEALSKPV
jgi:hypothetical protein